LIGTAFPTAFFVFHPIFPSVGQGTNPLWHGHSRSPGTYGTFSFYTDDPTAASGAVEGGEVIPVQVENSQLTANLIGPNNPFRKGSPPALEPFSVSLDPLEAVARISVQDREFVLREGEWSGWIPVEFRLIPFFSSVKGMCRFYLKQAHPRFQLYVSPINIDPADPALPISTPKSYSRELSEEVGEYHTQGIAEDTKALSDRVLDDKEYLDQARTVLAEHRRILMQSSPNLAEAFFSSTSPVSISTPTCSGG